MTLDMRVHKLETQLGRGRVLLVRHYGCEPEAVARARAGALDPDALVLLEPHPCTRPTPHHHPDPPEVASPWLAGEIRRLDAMSDLELQAFLATLRADRNN